MGNRAVITTPERKVGLYVHWNGGRDTIEPLLRYCELKGCRDPAKDEYGWARMYRPRMGPANYWSRGPDLNRRPTGYEVVVSRIIDINPSKSVFVLTQVNSIVLRGLAPIVIAFTPSSHPSGGEFGGELCYHPFKTLGKRETSFNKVSLFPKKSKAGTRWADAKSPWFRSHRKGQALSQHVEDHVLSRRKGRTGTLQARPEAHGARNQG